MCELQFDKAKTIPNRCSSAAFPPKLDYLLPFFNNFHTFHSNNK